jgi:hypothetical protein
MEGYEGFSFFGKRLGFIGINRKIDLQECLKALSFPRPKFSKKNPIILLDIDRVYKDKSVNQNPKSDHPLLLTLEKQLLLVDSLYQKRVSNERGFA